MDLKVDNSSLTGESEPQERHALPNGSKQRPVEAENLVFNSTLVVNGEAWGGKFSLFSPRIPANSGEIVVVRTGDHTFIGKLGIRPFPDITINCSFFRTNC